MGISPKVVFNGQVMGEGNPITKNKDFLKMECPVLYIKNELSDVMVKNSCYTQIWSSVLNGIPDMAYASLLNTELPKKGRLAIANLLSSYIYAQLYISGIPSPQYHMQKVLEDIVNESD